jgi:hypothetical protein
MPGRIDVHGLLDRAGAKLGRQQRPPGGKREPLHVRNPAAEVKLDLPGARRRRVGQALPQRPRPQRARAAWVSKREEGGMMSK